MTFCQKEKEILPQHAIKILQRIRLKPDFHLRIFSREANFADVAHAHIVICLWREQQKISNYFRCGENSSSNDFYFFAAKMVASQSYFSICVLHHFPVFKMADIEEQESNSSIGNNDIINDISQAYVNSQPPDNFDKAMFLEEVRKYRCLWDVNSESYKIRPVKQNAWLQIASVFKRDGKLCSKNSIFVFK